MKAQARQLSLESRKLDIFVENSSFYMADLARECMNEVQCLNLKKSLITSISEVHERGEAHDFAF